MVTPQDIADRLGGLNYAPDLCDEMVRQEGAEFARGFVGKLERADRLYHKWSPMLRSFESRARANRPCLKPEDLSDRDKAKLPIYESMITEAEQLGSSGNKVLICSIPLEGMSVAESLWPGDDQRCVLLTPDELLEWRKRYKHDVESFWWFIDYWWHIEDPPKAKPWTHDTDLTTPASTDPWLVISGLAWGGLAGGETADLWSWDGKEARLVRENGGWDS